MVSTRQRQALKERSDNRCEAMTPLPTGIYVRCWGTPVEVHHLLTRGRGGNILDIVGETYHLMHLCRRHHAMSDGGDAYAGGVLIGGYVITDERGKPMYFGPDEELTRKYPPRESKKDEFR